MRFPSLRGEIAPLPYAVLTPALLLSQHLLVALMYWQARVPLEPDSTFWLLPLRRLAELPGLSPWIAGLGFAFSLAVTWGVAVLSFRRASRSNYGDLPAMLSIMPAIQFGAVAVLVFLPRRPAGEDVDPISGIDVAHVLQGVLAGVAIIVFGVLISAVTFGAYGWGLFVMTPFLVGVTTAYLANRETALPRGRTTGLVMIAAALGSLALIMFALEGLVCILLASPLGALVAAIGGAIGRGLATIGHRRGKPLLSVALLPALFALEAATPPSIPIEAEQSIEIAAPPAAVWRALTSNEPIGTRPLLVAAVGFAYPIRGRLLGTGVGAERLGIFSTGVAHERVTDWAPGRRLAFDILSQPPMMEEMSPYRRVHAPHVSGYFETIRTSFALTPLPNGHTRLTARAAHVLRLDPALYWEPMARWAIRQNLLTVLSSLKNRAETGGTSHAAGDGA
jgi:hypothetical protein